MTNPLAASNDGGAVPGGAARRAYAVFPSHRGVVDTHLASMRVARNVRVMLPFFSIAPHLLPGTDLLFTTTRHFAEHYAKFLPLVIVRTPVDFPRMRFYQLWHDRTHHSPDIGGFAACSRTTGERLWKE
jgi:hypothetical protein